MAVNDELLDQAIARSLWGASESQAMANRIRQVMEQEVLPDIARQLAGLDPTDLKSFEQRLVALRQAIRRGIGFDRIQVPLMEGLEAMTQEEAQALVDGLRQTIPPTNVNFLMPSPEVLYATIFERPFNDKLMAEWFGQLDGVVQEDLYQAFRVGMIEGKSIPQMSKDLLEKNYEAFTTGGVNKAINNAKAVARTASNMALNRAREAVYEANSDIIKEVMYIATLDDRTTFICMDLHGNTYPIGEGERPPQHWQCRSTTVAITKSWREMGIDRDDIPPASQRDMDGVVPRPKNFDEWLKTKDPKVADKLLGPVRADLWRSGKVQDISGFVATDGKTIKLEDLGFTRTGRPL